jgi:hypothetical protein
MSLPTAAEVSENCVPVSCMPSPLSPANRIVAAESLLIVFSGPSLGAPVSNASSPPFSTPSVDEAECIGVVSTKCQRFQFFAEFSELSENSSFKCISKELEIRLTLCQIMSHFLIFGESAGERAEGGISP